MNFLNWSYYGNTARSWLSALALLVAVLAVMWVVRSVLARRVGDFSKRTRTTVDDLIAELLSASRLFFLLAVSVYAASQMVILPSRVGAVVQGAVIVLVMLQVGIWGNQLVAYLVSHYVRFEKTEDASAAASRAALRFVGKLVLWTLVLLLILDNLGYQITTLIAGLGIGGIAVALAAQNILGDLFASLSIMLDRPFVVGDVIRVDPYVGTVEHIGLKTTRVRSVSGEQLIFPNTDLLTSRIRNFKRMEKRRVVFSLGVAYETPYDKLAAIPHMIREIIESRENVRFDRAHFKEFGDFSLNFEVVYHVLIPDFSVHMNTQHSINLALFKCFQEEDIQFAYPTQTVYFQRQVGAAAPGNKS